jgi:hypothetical protein
MEWQPTEGIGVLTKPDAVYLMFRSGRSRNAILWRAFDSEEPLSDHKFKIGQRVNYRGASGWGIYQIVQLVPPVDDEPQ